MKHIIMKTYLSLLEHVLEHGVIRVMTGQGQAPARFSVTRPGSDWTKSFPLANHQKTTSAIDHL